MILCGTLALGFVAGESGDARAEPEAPLEPEAHALEDLHAESIHTRRVLADAVLVDGVVGLVAGGVLLVPDGDDQAWRFAGINTLVFGVVNTLVGIRALVGIGHEDSTWNTDASYASRRTAAGLMAARMHAAEDERRESVGHAINLGLDFGYLGVAGAAVLASVSGVSHPNRWLGSGISIGVSSLVLLSIDLAGLLRSGSFYRKFVQQFAPQVSFSDHKMTLSLGYAGRF